jgi:hypothetical protein
LDNSVGERAQTSGDLQTSVEEIDISDISEQDYVKKVVAAIGEVKKTQNKLLHKDTFIRIFKYTGDFAKLRSRDIKEKAQDARCKYFDGDHKKYLEELMKTVAEEEIAYEQSSTIIFDELCISPEMFERSQ